MDDRWESEVIEYGAVNITGFRIIDTKRKYVRDFLDGWRKLDSLSTQGTGKDSVSVSCFISPTFTLSANTEKAATLCLSPLTGRRQRYSLHFRMNIQAM